MQWCELGIPMMLDILECLADNRKLIDINISWNSLAMQLGEDAEIIRIDAANKIARIIKYNKKLKHLDISNTGITLQMFEIIANSLRKAISLLSIHMSNNPFIAELKETNIETEFTKRKEKTEPVEYEEEKKEKLTLEKVLAIIKAKKTINIDHSRAPEYYL